MDDTVATVNVGVGQSEGETMIAAAWKKHAMTAKKERDAARAEVEETKRGLDVVKKQRDKAILRANDAEALNDPELVKAMGDSWRKRAEKAEESPSASEDATEKINLQPLEDRFAAKSQAWHLEMGELRRKEQAIWDAMERVGDGSGMPVKGAWRLLRDAPHEPDVLLLVALVDAKQECIRSKSVCRWDDEHECFLSIWSYDPIDQTDSWFYLKTTFATKADVSD